LGEALPPERAEYGHVGGRRGSRACSNACRAPQITQNTGGTNSTASKVEEDHAPKTAVPKRAALPRPAVGEHQRVDAEMNANDVIKIGRKQPRRVDCCAGDAPARAVLARELDDQMAFLLASATSRTTPIWV
jgi:hypothetical protein